jgi:hypothetical protein
MHSNIESGSAVQVRLKGDVFISLENWRRAQEKIPPRSEAIRQLVELALRNFDQKQWCSDERA